MNPASGRMLCLLVLPAFLFANGVSAEDQPAPNLTQAEPRELGDLKPPSVLFELGPVVPGLRDGWIPQGLAYAATQDKLFISHYGKDRPSVVSVIDRDSGKITAAVALKESAEKFHTGHVGGVAVLDDWICVASEGKIFRYQLGPLLKENDPPGFVTPVATRKCETKASFCTATDEHLLVGEYGYGLLFTTDRLHHVTDRKGVKKRAWVCGYAKGDLQGKPRFVISVRQRVQGMCVAGERVFLSLSYGRSNRSTIVEYRNPIGEKAHSKAKLSDGSEVPLWFLDGENYVREIDFPPMSEGIAMVGRRLAVLSESGATKYLKGGQGPLDRLLMLDVEAGHGRD